MDDTAAFDMIRRLIEITSTDYVLISPFIDLLLIELEVLIAVYIALLSTFVRASNILTFVPLNQKLLVILLLGRQSLLLRLF